MKFIDMIGQKFGRITVVSLHSRGAYTTWNCICDCGKEKVIGGYHLRSGRIISCGCASAERIGNQNRKHGETKTRLHNIWCGLKTRCYNSAYKCYPTYGGRGITVCEEWNNSYETFRNWALRNGYDETLTIDRIDVNGNYEPSNCRWVTLKKQSNNTRRTRFIEYENEIYSVKELSELLNINYNKLLRGITEKNMSVFQAIEYAKTYKPRTKKENLNE